MRKLSLKEIMNSDQLTRSYYAYTLNVSSIAAAGVDTDSINIDSDSQFVWMKTAYFVDIAGAVQTDSSRVIPLINVQLTDSGSSRQFFDEPQPVNNFAGTGNIPFILPSPFVFRSNANINASFTNYSVATTYVNLKISLIGFRVYQYDNTL